VVAHACDPSYLRGRDQENCNLRPAWAKPLQTHPPSLPIKKPGQEREGEKEGGRKEERIEGRREGGKEKRREGSR
jgi:hypothetical protein